MRHQRVLAVVVVLAVIKVYYFFSMGEEREIGMGGGNGIRVKLIYL